MPSHRSTRDQFRRRIRPQALLVLIAIAFAPSPTLAHDWPGYRGGTSNGYAEDRPLPVTWSSSDNVRWVTDLPGEGHSSPAVYGSQIYLTAAYPRVRHSPLRQSTRFAVLVLLTWTSGMAIGLTRLRPGLSGGGSVSRAWAIRFLAGWMTAGILGGASLFDYERCGIRAWLASSVIASLCLALAATVGGWSANGRRILAALGVGLAALILAGIPYPDHAYRGGAFSANRCVVALVAAFPFGLGVWMWSTADRRSARWAGPASMMLTGLILGAGIIRLVVWTEASTQTLDPLDFVHWWAIVAVMGVIVGGRALGRFWPVGGRWVAAVGGAVAAVAITGKSVEGLTRASSYLRYHVGQPGWGWLNTPEGTAVGAGICVFAFCAAAIGPNSLGPFARVIAISVLILAGGHFAETNYLRPLSNSEWVFAIVSLDQKTGEPRWVREVATGPAPRIDRRNSLATPTPLVAEGRVVGYFGSAGLACCDLDGTLLWVTDQAPYESAYGVAASPVAADGVVVVVADPPGPGGYIRGFSLTTGRVMWEHNWHGSGHVSGNSRTPIVLSAGGRFEVVAWTCGAVTGYEAATGRLTWKYNPSGEYYHGDLVASPTADDRRIYLTSQGRTMALALDRLRAGSDPLDWTANVGANCPSPVAVNGRLYLVSDIGVASCLDARTGRVLFRLRLPGQYFAAPLASRRHVYFTNQAGRTNVVAIGGAAQFEVVAKNELGCETWSSIVPCEDALLIRSGRKLFFVGLPTSESSL